MATTGQLACVSASEDSSNGSSITLVNLSNLTDGDPATAVSQSGNGTPSRWALCGFAAPSPAIPSGSTINGITFRVYAWRTGAAGTLANFKAALNGSISGTEKGNPTLTTTPTTYDMGNSSDLHGLSPTVSDINNQLLGCAFTLGQFAPGGGRVGNVTLEVDYTPPASPQTESGVMYLLSQFLWLLMGSELTTCV